MTVENQRVLNDCATEISQMKNWINANKLDSNVRFLTAYSVVRSSGTIEIVMKSLIHSFLSDASKLETQTYLSRAIIDSSCNPSTSKILTLIAQFDTSRKEQFENITKGTQEKADLNSLVTLRNDVAHGRSISVSIEIVERYFNSGKTILLWLDQILYPQTISAV